MQLALQLSDWALPLLDRWRRFTHSRSGARLMPVSVAASGAAAGALFADRVVRSMWRHAIFTGPDQWRTAALVLAALWIMIGAITAIALLGPPGDAAAVGAAGVEDLPARDRRGAPPESFAGSSGMDGTA